jgi:hypothetical protein
MKTVYKYQIPSADEFSLYLPQGAQCLSIQVQKDTPCLWALVDPEQPTEARRFRIAGTGHPIANSNALSFLGTFQVFGGDLVFHLFEYAQ